MLKGKLLSKLRVKYKKRKTEVNINAPLPDSNSCLEHNITTSSPMTTERTERVTFINPRPQQDPNLFPLHSPKLWLTCLLEKPRCQTTGDLTLSGRAHSWGKVMCYLVYQLMIVNEQNAVTSLYLYRCFDFSNISSDDSVFLHSPRVQEACTPGTPKHKTRKSRFSFVILISISQSLKLSSSDPGLLKSQRGKDGGRGLATWSSLAKNPLRAGCYSDTN